MQKRLRKRLAVHDLQRALRGIAPAKKQVMKAVSRQKEACIVIVLHHANGSILKSSLELYEENENSTKKLWFDLNL